jgi:hypothetical protein
VAKNASRRISIGRSPQKLDAGRESINTDSTNEEKVNLYPGLQNKIFNLNPHRTYALAISFMDFGRFLAGIAREKSSNCVSSVEAYLAEAREGTLR